MVTAANTSVKTSSGTGCEKSMPEISAPKVGWRGLTMMCLNWEGESESGREGDFSTVWREGTVVVVVVDMVNLALKRGFIVFYSRYRAVETI